VNKWMLIRHSALELFLTAALLCGITTIIRFVVGPSAVSRAIPPIHLELIIVGRSWRYCLPV
jgi:glycerol uptake facilitator protein/aquaporin Z